MLAPSVSTYAPMPMARSRPVVMAETSGLSWYKPGEGAIFDPLKLVKTEADFQRFRYAEVKHGRVAMLAVLGHVTAASGARWPGLLDGGRSFSEIKGSGYAALEQCGFATWAIIITTVAFLEIRVMKEVVPGEFPGDLRNGLFKEGWDAYDEKTKKNKINIELNNGRAAMVRARGRQPLILSFGGRARARQPDFSLPLPHPHVPPPLPLRRWASLRSWCTRRSARPPTCSTRLWASRSRTESPACSMGTRMACVRGFSLRVEGEAPFDRQGQSQRPRACALDIFDRHAAAPV